MVLPIKCSIDSLAHEVSGPASRCLRPGYTNGTNVGLCVLYATVHQPSSAETMQETLNLQEQCILFIYMYGSIRSITK